MLVDLFVSGPAEAPGHGAGADDRGRLVPLGGGEDFRVVQDLEGKVGGQDDRRGGHRAGNRAPPGFVDAADEPTTCHRPSPSARARPKIPSLTTPPFGC